MSAAMANPIQIQSNPPSGKTITYIKVVQGAKIKPTMPNNQGRLNWANARFTLSGASNQKIKNAILGPNKNNETRKQHIVYSPPVLRLADYTVKMS